jgi:hypothetical protein
MFLPPPATGLLVGEPVEEVVIARDEAANLAWALHQVLPDPYGRPARVRPMPPAELPKPVTEAELVYIPSTSLPDQRVPLVLVENENGRFLVRGRLASDADGPLRPIGDLVPVEFRLRDEEVIDDGLRLQRRYELARTPDGMLYCWASRTKSPGARLAGSGLYFDRIEVQQQ